MIPAGLVGCVLCSLLARDSKKADVLDEGYGQHFTVDLVLGADRSTQANVGKVVCDSSCRCGSDFISVRGHSHQGVVHRINHAAHFN